MQQKYKGSKIIKFFSYFILFFIIIMVYQLSIEDVHDKSVNLLINIEDILFYFLIFLFPAVLAVIKTTKYYVLLSTDSLIINGLFKTKIINYSDICKITESNSSQRIIRLIEKATGTISGFYITYKNPKNQKYYNIYIGSSIQGFYKLYEYLRTTAENNKCK